jgi:hypothetical protein
MPGEKNRPDWATASDYKAVTWTIFDDEFVVPYEHVKVSRGDGVVVIQVYSPHEDDPAQVVLSGPGLPKLIEALQLLQKDREEHPDP